MPLVRVLSEETEKEIRTTLQQAQVALASAQELMQTAAPPIESLRTASARVDRILTKVEAAIDAIVVALGGEDAPADRHNGTGGGD